MHANAMIIKRAFELQNAHKAEELAAMFSDDSVFQDIPLGAFPADHTEMKQLWIDTWAALSGFQMTPGYIVADETGGAADFTMTGTHTGDFPGYAATGKSFSLKGASVIKIVDGMIIEWTDYWSTGDMERQLTAD